MSSRDEPRRRSRSPRGGRDRRDDRRDDYRSDGRRDAPRRDEYSSRDDPRDWDRDSRDRDHDRYDYRRGHDRDRDRPRDYDRRDPYARDREYTRGGLDYGRRGGGGGRRSRSRSRSPPRTLDRCAIEEARRKREEERARGVVFLEDGTKIVPKEEEEEEEEAPAPDEDVDEDTAAMAAMMGFGGFGTTKNTEVEGNEFGSAKVNKKRTWRQYMNRRGGFNRALDKMK